MFRFTLLCHKPLLIYLLACQSTCIHLTLNKPTFYLLYIDQIIFRGLTNVTFSLPTISANFHFLYLLASSQSFFTVRYQILFRVTPLVLMTTFYLLCTMLLHFLCTSHQLKRCLCTHIYNFLFTCMFNNCHYLCTHSQHCLFLLYLTIANPISVYPCVTTPSILLDNLHLLYTFTDNHHGKYQSEEPQHCC